MILSVRIPTWGPTTPSAIVLWRGLNTIPLPNRSYSTRSDVGDKFHIESMYVMYSVCLLALGLEALLYESAIDLDGTEVPIIQCLPRYMM